MMQKIKKVLLIDDDDITNMMHLRIIKKSGRVEETLVATDGQAALEILEGLIAAGQPLPELIFLDINMPRMGGFEFLDAYEARNIGAEGQKIIVMLSTSLMRHDHERAEADPNVHCFANKMIGVEAFADFVEEALSSGAPHAVPMQVSTAQPPGINL